MRVGIDLRAMQVGHQHRGIGEVLRHGCRQLDARLPAGDRIVAFHDDRGPSVVAIVGDVVASGRGVDLVTLPANAPRWQRLRDNLSPRQQDVMGEACDLLVQFDPLLGVPTTVSTVVIVHDQIPLLLGDRYPETYLPRYVAARRSGMGRRRAAERATRRWLYERNLTAALGRATQVIANSHHTARTTEEFAVAHGVADIAQRTTVAPLGHHAEADGRSMPPPNAMERHRFEALGLDHRPFVLYLGGVDDRRRLDLLVAAYNDLRARGVDLDLVLAGDSFATVDTIGIERTRVAIASSSYGEGIHLLGFATPRERAWLYDRAAVFAFPSEHEGFGLPVLEALAAGCAVVAFDNTAVVEVAGPNTRLVDATWRALAEGIGDLVARPAAQSADDAEAGRRWAATFTWETLGWALTTQVDRHRRR
jgi:glycosyltransferase involved in cell wall biosynthesis